MKRHLMSLAPQDLRTSSIRKRALRLGKPALWFLYEELLWALQEAGGELTSDPQALSDEVEFFTADQVAELLPLMAPAPGKRGGIVVAGDRIYNPRLSEAIAGREERDRAASEAGKRSAEVRRERYGSAQPPKPQPVENPERLPNAPSGDPERSSNAPSGTLEGVPNASRRSSNGRFPHARDSVSVAVPVSVSVSVSDSIPNSERRSEEQHGAAEPDHTLAASPSVSGDQHGNGNGQADDDDPDRHLRQAINHNHDNPTDVAIVDRCVQAAKRAAWLEDREPTEADVRLVLEAVSSTPGGVCIDSGSLLNVRESWKEQTLRAAEVFGQDLADDGQEPSA